MAKLDDEIKNMKTDIEELKRNINQISFNIVRIMGTLEKGSSVASGSGDGEGAVGSVSVDLGPLEERIESIENEMAKKSEIDKIYNKMAELVSEKITKSEDMQVRANNLLEKGMELIELQSTLAEIKNLLDERILGDDEE